MRSIEKLFHGVLGVKDAEGYLVAQATGAISADTLQRGIDMIRG